MQHSNDNEILENKLVPILINLLLDDDVLHPVKIGILSFLLGFLIFFFFLLILLFILLFIYSSIPIGTSCSII